MEQWTDQGIVLSVRPHGESGAIVSLMTQGYGRHAGYVQGAQSSALKSILQPGCVVKAHWASRVSENLGSYKLEEEQNFAAGYLNDALKLSMILSACTLCDVTIPERENHPGLFHGLLALFEALDTEDWAAVYVMWEIALLNELGFGLNLTKCAAGGDANALSHVSPKSGHAVSADKAEPYKDRLFELPAFLKPHRGPATPEEVQKGLELTAYFLEHWVFIHHRGGIPQERLRFQSRFVRNIDAQDKVRSDSESHDDMNDNDDQEFIDRELERIK